MFAVLGLSWFLCFGVVMSPQALIILRLELTTLLETVVSFPSMFLLAVFHQLHDGGGSLTAELTVIQPGGEVFIVETSFYFNLVVLHLVFLYFDIV